MLECGENGSSFLIGQHLCRTEFNVARNGHEKRNFVHEHNVSSENDLPVFLHERVRDSDVCTSDPWTIAAYGFALEDADVGSENVLCSQNVFARDGAVGDKMFVDSVHEKTRARTTNDSMEFASENSLRVLTTGILRAVIGYCIDQGDI